MHNVLHPMRQCSKPDANKDSVDLVEDLYNKYAPGIYGKILGMVKQKEVAEKILEKIFVTLPQTNNAKPKYITPFCHLLNHTNKKTVTTLKAIRTLQACGCNQEWRNPIIPLDSKIKKYQSG